MYDLPTSIIIDGLSYKIRSDYRAALDIIAALNDPDLNETEKILIITKIFYINYTGNNYQEVIDKIMWFINCGDNVQDNNTQNIKLMDWQQDFKIIAPAVNRILGYECRSAEYLHWWTFIGAYYEIGECVFSNIVSIRNKKIKDKKLEKHEQDFYRENKNIIDLKTNYTDDEQTIIDKLLHN